MNACVALQEVVPCVGVCPRAWKRGCLDVLIRWCVIARLRECVGV